MLTEQGGRREGRTRQGDVLLRQPLHAVHSAAVAREGEEVPRFLRECKRSTEAGQSQKG